MKKQLFIKKISELNSNLELSRKIRESISVPYEAPENSVLDMDIIHNATEAMKKLSDFEKDDLSDVLNILRNNDIETFGTILEKQSSDGELLFTKITKESSLKSSYYENLRRITDNTSAYHIYKNSVQNINSEILKISKSSKETIERFSLDRGTLSDAEWVISSSAFKLSQAQVAKNVGRFSKYIKFIPIIGIFWSVYSAITNIIDAHSIWSNEYEKYSSYGSAVQLYSVDYLSSLYDKNQDDFKAVYDIVNIIKMSKEFSEKFWTAVMHFIDIVETLLVSPLIVTGWGVLIEIAASYGMWKAGEAVIENRSDEFDSILKKIDYDMMLFEAKHGENQDYKLEETRPTYSIEDLEF
jgi:hypothetical protein